MADKVKLELIDLWIAIEADNCRFVGSNELFATIEDAKTAAELEVLGIILERHKLCLSSIDELLEVA